MINRKVWCPKSKESFLKCLSVPIWVAVFAIPRHDWDDAKWPPVRVGEWDGLLNCHELTTLEIDTSSILGHSTSISGSWNSHWTSLNHFMILTCGLSVLEAQLGLSLVELAKGFFSPGQTLIGNCALHQGASYGMDGLLGVAGIMIDSYCMLLWIIPNNSLRLAQVR